MSLYQNAMESFRFIIPITEDDGYGSETITWKDGYAFKAAFSYDTSTAARRAEKEGVKNLYTIYTPRNLCLMNGDIIRRLSDGRVFKITSDGTDKKTPMSTSLDMRVVSAEMLEGLTVD